MAKRNIIIFEEMLSKFYDKMSNVRKFDGTSKEGRFNFA